MPSEVGHGRVLAVVLNDRESETRTPAQPLYPLPKEARDHFSAQVPWRVNERSHADLTRIAPGRPLAHGQPIVVIGRVLDEDLRPVRNALVEIWNANAHGRYSHTDDSSRTDAPIDPNFYGFGRLVTDADGGYRLRTIKPAAYLARRDISWWRPPHVHFSILGGGVRLVTQMYFPGEPLNEQDFIHMIIPASDRHRAMGSVVTGSVSGDPTFRFDMVVRGRFQTPLDTD